jgi:AraC-like DNA-binding protein
MLSRDQRTQDITPPYDAPRPVVGFGFATEVATMKEFIDHRHRKAQFILTLSGVVICEADSSVWIVPPHCAIWIPGGLSHRVKGVGNVQICSVLVEPSAMSEMPGRCCTLAASPFLRELLRRATLFPELYDENGPESRIARVLLDELVAAPPEQLNLPMPSDSRLRKIADAMVADPSNRLTIAEWARRVGMAERTLTRLLRSETGMSFGRWRQQLHVLIALQRLADGQPVQIIALDLGYAGASAFITMFRKALGKSPTRYLSDRTSQSSQILRETGQSMLLPSTGPCLQSSRSSKTRL